MNRVFILLPTALFLMSCGSDSTSRPEAAAKKSSKAHITQFYASAPEIARGMNGQLCYGVDGAKSVELAPPVEQLWPAVARCFDVKPTQKTTYTLKAVGEDGSTDEKTASITVGAAPPRLYDLWVNSLEVKAGQPIQVCFKTENTSKVTVNTGKLDRVKNCVNDNPMKTTTYKITAVGESNEVDTGHVTVKVHP